MTAPAGLDADVYIAALYAREIFADASYQRDVDPRRVQKMADDWDSRLVGILEVSDRGEAHAPRYAVIDGQHRWAAAQLMNDGRPLVANVHAGLTIADEAALFDKLNRQRKQTGTWDHWRARRIAGDEQVVVIEEVVRRNGLRTEMSPSDGAVACVAALEKIVKLGGVELLHNTLSLIVEIWGDRREGLDAAMIHGLALVLWYLESAPLDLTRLGDALLDTTPRQIKMNAATLADLTQGSGPVRTAIAIMTLYNKRPGRRILVSNRTFTGARRTAETAVKP